MPDGNTAALRKFEARQKESRHEEAYDYLVDLWLSGESYAGVDITNIMDGEVIDDLLLAIASKRYDRAARILKRHCESYLSSETGEKLIEAVQDDWDQESRDAAAEAKHDGWNDDRNT